MVKYKDKKTKKQKSKKSEDKKYNMRKHKNFWEKLPKSFTALAPMAGVTDFPFREVIAEIGAPDIFFTEFVSTEMIFRRGAVSAPNKKGGVTPPLQLHFSDKQRPIVAQFFGCKIEQFEKCARLALELGFDGIDINMGCPDRKVLKQGSGSELIRNPELAVEIVRTVKEVVGGKIPVSIKTRIGYNKKEINHILAVAKEGIDAITIHGRTVKQGYSGGADWEEIGRLAELIKQESKKTKKQEIKIIGNGDVKDLEQGKMLAEKYGLDGVMIGRGILHNPWLFKKSLINQTPTMRERLNIARKHTEIFQKFYGNKSSFGAMKKYYKAYFSGVEIKKELMNCKSFDEAKIVLMPKL